MFKHQNQANHRLDVEFLMTKVIMDSPPPAGARYCPVGRPCRSRLGLALHICLARWRLFARVRSSKFRFLFRRRCAVQWAATRLVPARALIWLFCCNHPVRCFQKELLFLGPALDAGGPLSPASVIERAIFSLRMPSSPGRSLLAWRRPELWPAEHREEASENRGERSCDGRAGCAVRQLSVH